MPGPGQRISISILAVQTGIWEREGAAALRLYRAGQGNRVPSVVSFGTHANASSVQVALFADMPREDLAKPRSLAISKPVISKTRISKTRISKTRISKTDRALDKCGKVLDHLGTTGLPVAFIRMIDECVFFNRAAPSVRWAEGFERCRDEMHSNEIADRATLANRSRDFMQKHLNRRID